VTSEQRLNNSFHGGVRVLWQGERCENLLRQSRNFPRLLIGPSAGGPSIAQYYLDCGKQTGGAQNALVKHLRALSGVEMQWKPKRTDTKARFLLHKFVLLLSSLPKAQFLHITVSRSISSITGILTGPFGQGPLILQTEDILVFISPSILPGCCRPSRHNRLQLMIQRFKSAGHNHPASEVPSSG
jgi:hypothetical protein